MIITIPVNELKGGMIVLKFDKLNVPYAYMGKNLPDSSLREVISTLKENNVLQAYVKVNDSRIPLKVSNSENPPSKAPVDNSDNEDVDIKAPSIIEVDITDLKGGMVVAKFDKSGVRYSYYGRPIPSSAVSSVLKDFATKGVTKAYIKLFDNIIEQKEKKIKEIPKSIASRLINDEKPKNVTSETFSDISKKAVPIKQNVIPADISDVIESQKVHVRAKEITKGVLQEVRLGKAIHTDAAKDVVASLVDNCFKNPDTFVNMTRLKDFDDYTFTHSVNVSVLAVSIGRRLGMNAKELQNLGLAGLTHDVGKMRVPERILNKPDKLTEEEFQIIKTHTTLGYHILRQDKEIPLEVAIAAKQHHEKADGSGYPDKLKDRDISKFGKILAIADVYDAVTSDRVYHKGLMPPEALKMIFSWSGKHFNDILVKFFIDLIGIYPVGTVVLLDTSELAIIYQISKDNIRPKIIVISDTKGELISDPYVFDLASYNLITKVPYKTILSAVSKNNLNGLDPNKVLSKFIDTFK